MGKDMSKKDSPLKRLVEAQEKLNLPVKVTPTKRVIKSAEVVDAIPLAPITTAPDKLSIQDSGLAISNSSLTVNINLNLDSKAVDRAMQQSAKIAKGIAASAAAMIGTAFIFSTQDKRVGKTRMPLMPKVRIPKMD